VSPTAELAAPKDRVSEEGGLEIAPIDAASVYEREDHLAVQGSKEEKRLFLMIGLRRGGEDEIPDCAPDVPTAAGLRESAQECSWGGGGGRFFFLRGSKKGRDFVGKNRNGLFTANNGGGTPSPILLKKKTDHRPLQAEQVLSSGRTEKRQEESAMIWVQKSGLRTQNRKKENSIASHVERREEERTLFEVGPGQAAGSGSKAGEKSRPTYPSSVGERRKKEWTGRELKREHRKEDSNVALHSSMRGQPMGGSGKE